VYRGEGQCIPAGCVAAMRSRIEASVRCGLAAGGGEIMKCLCAGSCLSLLREGEIEWCLKIAVYL